MWYGKLAIILFMFSVSLLFSSYFINQVFNDPFITNSVTNQSLKTLAGTFQFNQQIDAQFIFGDFNAVKNVIFALMTGGGAFTQAFGDHGITHGLEYSASDFVSILMGLLFNSSVVFLILYIVSNRSL